MYDTDEDYIKKESDYEKNIRKENSFKFEFLFINIFILISYLIIISSVFLQFIPIQPGNWFNLGMGKYVGLAVIFGSYFILTKNYFPAFFISLFSSFFVFHEVIIFYDNYAIELGQELGSNGTFRLVFEIFKNAFNVKYGAFWAVFGSIISLIIISLAWIANNVVENQRLTEKSLD